MNAATVVLFIFVNHGPTSRPPDGVVSACVRALPDGARAVVRTASETPPDEAVVNSAAASGAGAAVVVSWDDAGQLGAHVRVATGLPAHVRWESRPISFDAADQLAERERALGLVIASILDAGLEPAAAPRAAPPSARPPPVPPPAPETERRVVAGPEPPLPGWAIEAEVTTAFESGNDLDDTIGGAIGVRRALSQSLAMRAGLAFRLTEWDGLDVRTRTVVGSVGLAWTARSHARPGSVGFGVRADFLAARESVLYSGRAAGAGEEQSFSSLGADLLAEVGFGLSRDTALLAGFGGEMLFTAADLVVDETPAATLHRGRLLLLLGILSRF